MNHRPLQHTLAPALPQNQIAPQGNPIQGGERRYVQTLPLFRNSLGSGAYPVAGAEGIVWTPSTRLFVTLTIGFLPDRQEDATIPAGWVATMDAWARSDSHGFGQGRYLRGNSIIPGPSAAIPTQLPWSWDAVTGVDQWRFHANVPEDGTGLAVDGFLVASVNWEPAPGDDIPADELRRLFTACKLQAGAGAGTAVFNTIG